MAMYNAHAPNINDPLPIVLHYSASGLDFIVCNVDSWNLSNTPPCICIILGYNNMLSTMFTYTYIQGESSRMQIHNA